MNGAKPVYAPCVVCGHRGFHSTHCVLGGDVNRPVVVARSLAKRTHEVVREEGGSYVTMRAKDEPHTRRVSPTIPIHIIAHNLKDKWDEDAAHGAIPDYEVYE